VSLSNKGGAQRRAPPDNGPTKVGPDGLLPLHVLQHTMVGASLCFRRGMTDFDLHQWFAPDDLEPCPSCCEREGIRLPASGSFLCLGCGHIVGPPEKNAASTRLPTAEDRELT